MKVAITGATSAIGTVVAHALTATGHEVTEVGRRRSTSSRRFIHWDLTSNAAPALPQDLESIVHLSWSWGDDATNLSAGRRLIGEAARHGIRPILLSTFSAFAADTSAYGAAKLALEDEVSATGGSSLRAGVVWGDGASGIVSTLARIANVPAVRASLTPEPLMYHSQLQPLAASVAEAAASVDSPPLALAAYPVPVPLGGLLGAFRGSKPGLPLPVPIAALLLAGGVADRLRVPLPFRTDSVRAVSDGTPVFDDRIPWAQGFGGADALLAWARGGLR